MKSLYPILAILVCSLPIFANPNEKPIKIQLNLNTSPDFIDDSVSVTYYNLYTQEFFTTDGITKYYKLPVQTNIVFNASSVTSVVIYLKKRKYYANMLLMPGEEAAVQIDEDGLSISGAGSKTYDFFYKELPFRYKSLTPPSDAYVPADLREMRAWNEYYDKKQELFRQSLSLYSSQYPSPVWNIVEQSVVPNIEGERHAKFSHISENKKKYGLTQAGLKKIYYSEICNDHLRKYLSQEAELPNLECFFRIFSVLNFVENDFDDPKNHSIYNSDSYNKYREYFNLVDEKTRGQLRDQLKIYFLFSRVLHGGVTKEGIQMAEDLYPTLNNPEYYKPLIRQGLLDYTRYASEVGNFVFFQLLDKNGKPVDREQYKQDIILVHLPERGRLEDNHFFQSAYKKYGQTKKIVFVTISGEGTFEEWQQRSQKTEIPADIHQWYAPHSGDYLDFNLMVKGTDTSRSMFLWPGRPQYHNNIYSAAQLKKLKMDAADPTMLSYLDKQLRYNDGPYVYQHGDTSFVYNVRDLSPVIDTLMNNKIPELEVLVNSEDRFNLRIRGTALPPPAVYKEPSKMLVLSDLEGNFETFRNFLINHKVIDTAYNWSYGDGHLVITGDMMDRGKQVIQCLWLVYVLEEKAEKAGGFVHFILGNHEVMNLTGDYSYVPQEYHNNANMFRQNYSDLISPQTVLGQWLRSKNIMEKIGDNLIVHGGISAEVNALMLSVEKLNMLHHSFLNSKSVYIQDRKTVATLANSKVSPYWYRGYYKKNAVPETEMVAQIDNTLQLYKAKRIITGHTIVKDVEVFYNGKVINTDTRHASGDSEGLIIEGKKPYRALSDGSRELLH